MREFTVPEINFLCIYAGKNREETVCNIMSAIPVFTDGELVRLAEDVIVKLDRLSDSDFSDWDFAEQFTDDYGE